MRIYISGPITGTQGWAVRFEEAEVKLAAAFPDAKIVNPSYLGVVYPGYEHHEYMTMCMILLGKCDVIYMLDGWERSKGAKMELKLALENGLKIVTEGNVDVPV